jgi:hypothetical protein
MPPLSLPWPRKNQNNPQRGATSPAGPDPSAQWATAQNYKLLVREKGRIAGQPALRLVAV